MGFYRGEDLGIGRGGARGDGEILRRGLGGSWGRGVGDFWGIRCVRNVRSGLEGGMGFGAVAADR